MTKYFCDACGQEITEENECKGGHNTDGRLGTELLRNGHKIKVEILTTMNGTANAGLFCKYCVLDALLRLDNRPVAADQSSTLDRHHRLAEEIRALLHNGGAGPNLSQLKKADKMLCEIAGLPAHCS